MKKIVGLIIAMIICVGLMPLTVLAEDCGEGQVETSILGGGGCMSVEGNVGGATHILSLVLNIMTVGVGVLATVGFVISGIQYLTARDNDGQIAKAKMRMLQIVIGLFVFATMWALLNWILPGGVFAGK